MAWAPQELVCVVSFVLCGCVVCVAVDVHRLRETPGLRQSPWEAVTGVLQGSCVGSFPGVGSRGKAVSTRVSVHLCV